MKTARRPYQQQGDVLLFETAKIPKGAKLLPGGVVQEGEHTGHAHRLQFRHDDGGEPRGKVLVDEHGVKWVSLKEPTDLTHEEHHTQVVTGNREVRIVQEYDHFAEEARAVQD